ncbi:Atg16 protein [Maudiozyma humilis]|uniref:Atg16 protein n=1 Tax=Maudiozyma humilis TaxID=51915 RepID=A0AAV5RTH1_MAUHU|nr:Atg16 protein [Kazachstania humilis]
MPDEIHRSELLQKLQGRDTIESNFSELFEDILPNEDNLDVDKAYVSEYRQLVKHLRSEVQSRDNELVILHERLTVMNKNMEKINDEIIGSSIENNVLQQKYDTLRVEYDKLVQRWLKKVQKEADKMNEHVAQADNQVESKHG